MLEISVNTLIIIVTVVVSWQAWQKPALFQRWLFSPYKVQKSQDYKRFVTSAFLHADYMHLAFNMITLYFFGGFVEHILQVNYNDSIGRLLFLLLYFVGVIVAHLPSFFKYKNMPYYNSVGASGGVSAIVFAYIAIRPLSDLCLYFIICLPSVAFGAIYLMYSYWQGKRNTDNINHDAHLWGAIFGFIFIMLVLPNAFELFLWQLKQFGK